MRFYVDGSSDKMYDTGHLDHNDYLRNWPSVQTKTLLIPIDQFGVPWDTIHTERDNVSLVWRNLCLDCQPKEPIHVFKRVWLKLFVLEVTGIAPRLLSLEAFERWLAMVLFASSRWSLEYQLSRTRGEVLDLRLANSRLQKQLDAKHLKLVSLKENLRAISTRLYESRGRIGSPLIGEIRESLDEEIAGILPLETEKRTGEVIVWDASDGRGSVRVEKTGEIAFLDIAVIEPMVHRGVDIRGKMVSIHGIRRTNPNRPQICSAILL